MASVLEAAGDVTVRPAAGCGAFVEHIDLTQPLSDNLVEKLRYDLHEYGVLFFRDQDLTPAQQAAFAGRFGRNYVSPYVPPAFPELPEIFIINESDKGAAARWHSDVTFEEVPAQYSMLQALTVPRFGGDTLWASMTKAYAALSPAVQTFLEGLTATHDFLYSARDRSALKERMKKNPDLFGDSMTAVHPVVIRDPLTGRKAIYVSPHYTLRINELSPNESDAVLRMVFEHSASPEFQVRLHWEPHTIALWNNEVVQHYATTDYDEPRRMLRVGIETDHRPGL